MAKLAFDKLVPVAPPERWVKMTEFVTAYDAWASAGTWNEIRARYEELLAARSAIDG